MLIQNLNYKDPISTNIDDIRNNSENDIQRNCTSKYEINGTGMKRLEIFSELIQNNSIFGSVEYLYLL